MKICSVPWCLTHNQPSKNCQEMFDHIEPIPPAWTQQPTPTSSITVGTQVRLTGVVEEVEANGNLQVRFCSSWSETLHPDWVPMEVIRQPFKRGEVVYSKVAATNEVPTFVVLNDESLGFIDVTNCETGFYIPNDNAEAYERRP